MFTQKKYIQVTGALFGAKAIFGLIYIFWGWQTTIASWDLPLWLIIVAVIVDSYLAYLAAKLTKVMK